MEQVELEVELTYQDLANGRVDLFLDAWLPDTHGRYREEHGANLEQLSPWNSGATLHLAVPDYVDADIATLDDLADNSTQFGDRIVGIEPQAGLSERVRDEVIPRYGLEDMTLDDGSTPEMLEALDTAVASEEPIVVTLWHPHWAYDAYELRDLEDPQGTLGDGESLYPLTRYGFAEDHPEVAGWLDRFNLDNEELEELVNLVVREYDEGQEEEAVDEWLSDPDNRALADSWLAG